MDWAYTVAISVFAFSRNGAAGVGLVTLIRLMPAAASAPFTAAGWVIDFRDASCSSWRS